MSDCQAKVMQTHGGVLALETEKGTLCKEGGMVCYSDVKEQFNARRDGTETLSHKLEDLFCISNFPQIVFHGFKISATSTKPVLYYSFPESCCAYSITVLQWR